MGRIVAIAGGDLSSTREINIHTIKLTNKTNPNVLFIGTASRDAEGYIEAITNAFNLLTCEVKALCLCSKDYDDKGIDDLLTWADIIYVGGGDTISMMQIWKKHGLDEKFKRIYEKDLAVLIGLILHYFYYEDMTVGEFYIGLMMNYVGTRYLLMSNLDYAVYDAALGSEDE